MTAPTAWGPGHFVAGDVALDLANTVYRRRPVLGADLLPDPTAFGSWLVAVGLLTTRPDPTATALDRARTVRAALWAAFDAQIDGEQIPPTALTDLLDTAGRSTLHGSLHVAADGALTASDVDGALAVVALRAVALLLHPPPQGVRSCDRCGWLFIDTSRGRRRRWCSMQTCGNQAKAARHRSRNDHGL